MFVICKTALNINQSRQFIIDSFPVAVCQNNKIFRCKIFKSKSYRGYTASKKSYFFGVKVHMTVTSEGIPVEFLITPGSTGDAKALRSFSFDLPKGSTVYGDSAYNSYAFETCLNTTCMIKLVPKRRKNSRRKNSSIDELFLRFHRGRIETTFSEITHLMPRNIQAKTPKGFLLKVLFFILGYTLKRLFKKK